MKITDVEVIVVKQPEIALIGDGSQDTVVIRVKTDEGIEGIGEVESSPYIVKSIIETPASHELCRGLRDAVMGEDPFDVEKLWRKMYQYSYYYGRRSVAIHAMSGIDIAIWDIMGKAVGKPVHKLIGGAFRDKIPAYCSVLMPDSEDEIRRIAATYLPQGFKGIKFGWGALGERNEKDLRLVSCAREAMGDSPMLMIDMLCDGRTIRQQELCAVNLKSLAYSGWRSPSPLTPWICTDASVSQRIFGSPLARRWALCMNSRNCWIAAILIFYSPTSAAVEASPWRKSSSI